MSETNQSYREIVESLRQAFPQPVSDPVHDAYFVFNFLKTLDRVDQLKSERPLLGEPVGKLDHESARREPMPEAPRALEEVSKILVDHLSGMFIWGHPKAQINVIPAPTIPSILGGLIPSLYNPNLCSEESSRQFALAEEKVTAMVSGMIGYAPEQARGLFTFGGTGTLLYGVKVGLEKACPGIGRTGQHETAFIICSRQSHYACKTVANWLNLGELNVELVPTSTDNSLRIDELETQLKARLSKGHRLAAIIATMGTTDAFGLDDLKAIVTLRDKLVDEFQLEYIPHVHADSVIGWAWAAFNDYDFSENPLGFRRRTIRALASTHYRIQHLKLADSLGIDFHKTGFTPYVSSQFIVKSADDLNYITRPEESTPYLFQSGSYHPGKQTLETSRSASGTMAALANLLLFGKEGFRALLGYLVSVAEALRESLSGLSFVTVVNSENSGPVTLFRVYPAGVDTFQMWDQERTNSEYRDKLLAHNAYNRQVFDLIQADALKGEGVVLSLTDCYRETDYGEPIVALKSYIMSPFDDESSVEVVVKTLENARNQLAEESTD